MFNPFYIAYKFSEFICSLIPFKIQKIRYKIIENNEDILRIKAEAVVSKPIDSIIFDFTQQPLSGSQGSPKFDLQCTKCGRKWKCSDMQGYVCCGKYAKAL